MFYLVLAVHVLVSLFLILVVLLQSGKGGDIASAFGGGGTQTVFGPRGTSNVLTRATTIAAVMFMVTSLTLVLLTQRGGGSVLDDLPAQGPAPAAQTEPAAQPDSGQAPAAPEGPSEQNVGEPAEEETAPPAEAPGE